LRSDIEFCSGGTLPCSRDRNRARVHRRYKAEIPPPRGFDWPDHTGEFLQAVI